MRLPLRRAVLAGSVSQTTLDQLAGMQGSGEAPWYDLEAAPPRAGQPRRFALSSLRRRSQMKRLKSRAAQLRFGGLRIRSLVRRGLSMAGGPQGRLWLLTGGHCATEFFSALGLKGARVRGMLLGGLPLLEAHDGSGARVLACSKPGGFGTPGLITEFMRIRSFS